MNVFSVTIPKGTAMDRALRLDAPHDWVVSRYHVRLRRPDLSFVTFTVAQKTELDEILEAAASLDWSVEELAAPRSWPIGC